jgi:hypothetical protein
LNLLRQVFHAPPNQLPPDELENSFGMTWVQTADGFDAVATRPPLRTPSQIAEHIVHTLQKQPTPQHPANGAVVLLDMYHGGQAKLFVAHVADNGDWQNAYDDVFVVAGYGDDAPHVNKDPDVQFLSAVADGSDYTFTFNDETLNPRWLAEAVRAAVWASHIAEVLNQVEAQSLEASLPITTPLRRHFDIGNRWAIENVSTTLPI